MVVVIAHRLSTVRKADSIIVLNRGEIVEQGTREALLSQPGSLFAGNGAGWCAVNGRVARASCARDAAAAARTIEATQIWRLCRRNRSK
jgi:ABC-type microcin C transport system duplicated ATPase subunit YejF